MLGVRPAVDHQIAAGLQGERAEGAGRSVSVQMHQRTKGHPVLADFAGLRTVGAAIVVLGVTQEGEVEFVDAQVRRLRILGLQAPIGGLPFGDDAGILLPAGSGAVLA